MAKKLYALRNVPDDEAEEMRVLLRESSIYFHETTAGFIGIGTAAIWVNDESQFENAQHLIEEYQLTRYTNAREDYLSQKAAGSHKRFTDVFIDHPLRTIAYIGFALFLLFLVARPFWF